MFTPKFGKKNCRNSKAPKIVSSRNRLHKGWYQLILCSTGIGSLQIAPADNDKSYAGVRKKHVGLYKKGKIGVQVILN